MLIKICYFILVWIVEKIIPDRKKEEGIFQNKTNIYKIINSRFVGNYLNGILWLLFISFFGKTIYKNYNQLYFFIYHSLNFRGNGLFSILIFFLVLDYSTYLWHRANHNFKLLRNFHQVHHSDLWVDSSTTFRFHFIELLFQLIFKLILVFLLKMNLIGLLVFETTVLVFGVFHHSNIYLPKKIDSFLSFFIVTPRYHYNHHLLDLNYANSNYSSLLTVWDKLHGTYTEPVGNSDKPLGVSGKNKTLNFWQLLKMPFKF